MFNKLGPANIDLNNCNSSYLSVGSILTASILVCLPVLLYGVPSGNDLPQHYQFAQTVFDNLKSSDYYAGLRIVVWRTGVGSDHVTIVAVQRLCTG